MKFRYPVNYVAITQKFKQGKHHGIDLGWSSKEGGPSQPIYAAESGTVIIVKDHDKSSVSWGNYVKIDHGNKMYTLYAHLLEGVVAKKGQKVKKGDLLGYMGNTGHSFGNHLHFEIYEGSANTTHRVDPLPRTYVYEGQIVSNGSKDDVLYYKDTPTADKIIEDGYWGVDTTKKAQKVFGTPVDGKVSNQYAKYKKGNPGLLESTFEWEKNPSKNGSLLIGKIQELVGSKVDKFIGTDTIKDMQKFFKTPVDGKVSKPSMMVKEFQKWLNKQ